MECTICEKKFNSVSSFYRHNWSNTHLLVCQIKEYEREICVLERKIQRLTNFENHDISDSLSEIMTIPRLEKATAYA